MATSARNSVVSLVSTTPSGMAQSGRHQQHVETKLLEDEGIVLPSSSSKDEDNLSESSDDIEMLARQTLERIHEDLPKSFDSPSRKTKQSSSGDISNYATSEPSKIAAKTFSIKNLSSNSNVDIEADDSNNNNGKTDTSKKKDVVKNRGMWKMNENEEQDRDEGE